MNDEKSEIPFYKKDWFLYLSLLILPLFGIMVMWHFRKDMDKPKKASLTLVFAIWFMLIPLANRNYNSNVEGTKAISPYTSMVTGTAPAAALESEQTEMTTTELIVTTTVSTTSYEAESVEHSTVQSNDEQHKDGELYVLNTKKFHHSYCSSVKTIHDENYDEYFGTREEVIERGYEPCGRCHP